jgi:anti-sigma factor RsiW
MKSSKEVAELIKKYIEGNISSEESIQLNSWIKEKPEHAEFF